MRPDALEPYPDIQKGHLPLHFSSVGGGGTRLEQLKMHSGKLLSFLTNIVVISLLMGNRAPPL